MPENDLVKSMLKSASEVGALLYLSENSTYQGMDKIEVFGGYVEENGEWKGEYTLFRNKETGQVFKLNAVIEEVQGQIEVAEEWRDK